MNCDLQPTGEPNARGMIRYQCSRCGATTAPLPPPPARIARTCQRPADDCLHRGEEIRTADCPTCSGHVRVKVFACAIHSECTLAKPLPGIACCQGCGDYAPRPGR